MDNHQHVFFFWYLFQGLLQTKQISRMQLISRTSFICSKQAKPAVLIRRNENNATRYDTERSYISTISANLRQPPRRQPLNRLNKAVGQVNLSGWQYDRRGMDNPREFPNQLPLMNYKIIFSCTCKYIT